MGITVGQFDSGRANNFDLLRFVAASLVIFSHSYLVTGHFNIEPLARTVGFEDFGSFGVNIFFTISGYLITKSLIRQTTLASFVWARFLRIFPGLCLAALFCVFVIGPLSTTLASGKYFGDPATYDFLWRMATLHDIRTSLPGVFTTNPYPNGVDNPVWTLPGEILMYACVLFCGVMSLLVKKQFRALWAALPVLIIVVAFFWHTSYPASYMGYVYTWAILFFLGGACYLLRNSIVLSIPLLLVMLVVFGLVFHYRLGFRVYAFDVLLVYFILVFAYHPKLQVNGFHKLGDVSYGLYVYAFPVQQLLIMKFPQLSPVTHFLITYPIVFLMALLSWHFLEKPLLKLKTATLYKR